MTDRELMQMALDALNRSDYLGWQLNIPIIKALRARLSQPEPEPVVKYSDIISDGGLDPRNNFDTAPPQREWQGLTDEERLALWSGIECDLECLKPAEFARAIEAKLKEKNT